MKDKLEKTGHKKNYYLAKTALSVLMFAVALVALAAIPVGISYKLAEAEAKGGENHTSQLASSASAATEVASAGI